MNSKESSHWTPSENSVEAVIANYVRAREAGTPLDRETLLQEHPACADDLRDFEVSVKILEDLGVKSVVLNTNNPDKVASLESHGIRVERVVPSTAETNPHNVDYLRTKARGLGHVGLEGALRPLE